MNEKEKYTKLFSDNDYNLNIPVDHISILLKSLSNVVDKEKAIQNLTPALLLFAKVLETNEINILKKLADNSIVFWDEINEKIVDILDNNEDICEILDLKDNINYKYFDCSIIINKSILNQSIEAFYTENYGLCAFGLFTIIDGMLSNYSDSKNKLNVVKVTKHIIKRAKKCKYNQPKSIYYLIYTLIPVIIPLYKRLSFNEEEPKFLNRHWALHGRSRRVYLKKDCLILFRVIKALKILNDYIIKNENKI